MRTQAPAIILPVNPIAATSVELINDLAEHTSFEFYSELLQEKTIHIFAQEWLLAPGVPGNLLCWIETSPFPTANSAFWTTGLPVSADYWAPRVGGLGAPVTPLIIVGAGVSGNIQTQTLNWTIHSKFARLVVRTPVAAALPAAFWAVQAIVSGKALSI